MAEPPAKIVKADRNAQAHARCLSRLMPDFTLETTYSG